MVSRGDSKLYNSFESPCIYLRYLIQHIGYSFNKHVTGTVPSFATGRNISYKEPMKTKSNIKY